MQYASPDRHGARPILAAAPDRSGHRPRSAWRRVSACSSTVCLLSLQYRRGSDPGPHHAFDKELKVTSCPSGHRPLIGLRCQILEGNGRNRRWIGIDHGGLALHRTPEVVVKRYGTRKLQCHIEESITDSRNFLEKTG